MKDAPPRFPHLPWLIGGPAPGGPVPRSIRRRVNFDRHGLALGEVAGGLIEPHGGRGIPHRGGFLARG